MLHYMLREEAYTGHTEFYQLPSTLRLRYDRRKGDFDYFTYCGREVGKEIGKEIGKAIGEAGIIINMHNNGFTAQQISAATNKDLKEVERIIEGKELVTV